MPIILKFSGTVYMAFYTKLWQCLLSLEDDPYPGVAAMARTVLDNIRDQVT